MNGRNQASERVQSGTSRRTHQRWFVLLLALGAIVASSSCGTTEPEAAPAASTTTTEVDQGRQFCTEFKSSYDDWNADILIAEEYRDVVMDLRKKYDDLPFRVQDGADHLAEKLTSVDMMGIFVGSKLIAEACNEEYSSGYDIQTSL